MQAGRGRVILRAARGMREEKQMDLRSYYKKVRDAEATLEGESVVVVSLPTTEGGKAGVMTEVPRIVAAKLIAEMRAVVATQDETLSFRLALTEAKEKHDREEAARRVQVMVIPASEFQKRDRG